jgi:hypothetical protein
MELSDPKTQDLQMRYCKTLTEIGTEVSAYKFPYPFYFSRALDLDQSSMAQSDLRSIRFDTYKTQTVKVTGNYHAAYSRPKDKDGTIARHPFATPLPLTGPVPLGSCCLPGPHAS